MLVVSGLSIYLRGYLVPGTPALTKRFLPASVLNWFGKTPVSESAITESAQFLRDGGLVRYCPTTDDVRLVEGVRTEWHERMDAITVELIHERFGKLLEAEDIEIQKRGEGVHVVADEIVAVKRRTTVALRVDAAAIPLLRDRCPDWETLSIDEKDELLRTLRVFLETCPSCGEELAHDTDEVESCCSTQEVYTLSCEGCDRRLSEVPSNS
ncbi:hypothetical protein BV210_12460 [Halorientalis sp. IM1011]|nr:hypothetical protein BV210_12460 [Halorientalis sp. IM1011]